MLGTDTTYVSILILRLIFRGGAIHVDQPSSERKTSLRVMKERHLDGRSHGGYRYYYCNTYWNIGGTLPTKITSGYPEGTSSGGGGRGG